jgi:signal transduction histidine kinase
LFEDLLHQHPIYANFGAIRSNGEVFCSGLPLAGPVNLADRLYFRRALETRAFAVGEYQVGRITGKATVNLGYPIFDDENKVQGVVFAALDLAWLNDLAAKAGLPAGSTLTVVDHHGIVLARYPDPERWVGKPAPERSIIEIVRARGEGVAEAPGLGGVSSLFGFTTLRGGPEAGAVYVNVGIPKRAAYANANRVLKNDLFAIGILTIAIFFATRLFADRFILRPVDALLKMTRGLAAGELGTRSRMVPERGELGQLARAFDEMADALQAREAELERQREALHRNERMAALGRLAAGLAHELRNPLTVVEGRVELMLSDLMRPEPHLDAFRGQLAKVEEAAQRMRRIMEGLSTYSKPPKPQPTLLDVTSLLQAVHEVVAFEARKAHVEISVEVVDPLPKILGDRSQLMQVLVNLATNAIEAMAGTGGRLGLRAYARGAGADRSVTIEVSDTGSGISDEALPKIWEAFYTTKPEGTGLGLSIVRTLVAQQPGATVDVETTLNRGTTFALTFPARE